MNDQGSNQNEPQRRRRLEEVSPEWMHASVILRNCDGCGAPDETSALKAAIEEFGIINPEHQNRLFVRRAPSDDDFPGPLSAVA